MQNGTRRRSLANDKLRPTFSKSQCQQDGGRARRSPGPFPGVSQSYLARYRSPKQSQPLRDAPKPTSAGLLPLLPLAVFSLQIRPGRFVFRERFLICLRQRMPEYSDLLHVAALHNLDESKSPDEAKYQRLTGNINHFFECRQQRRPTMRS